MPSSPTMASFGRSLKSPPAFLSRRPPSMSARTMSNSSDRSAASVGSRSDEFAESLHMSGLNTPDGASPSKPAGSFNQPIFPTTSQASANNSLSRPITINLPGIRKSSGNTNASTPPPPQPLSARGDLPGGYFPFHEDPTARVQPTHPFHADSRRARQESISLADERASPEQQARVAGDVSPSRASLAVPSYFSGAMGSDAAHTSTPVTSYNPSGIHDSTLPMGKYYPSNYEQRHDQPRPHPAPIGTKSDSLVPTQTGHSINVRQDLDAKKRLQQYQRDMIAQATMAANQVLGRSPSLQSASQRPAASTGMTTKSMQLMGSGMHKPISPRLLPLGSPGPVTPMDLQGEDHSVGILDRAFSQATSDSPDRREEMARAIRADEQRRRREATSPSVGFGI